MKFEHSLYTVNESVGRLDVCLQRLDSAIIAPGVTIPLLIEELSSENLGMFPVM